MRKYNDVREIFDKSDAHITIDVAKKQRLQDLIKERGKAPGTFVSVRKWQLFKMQVYYMDKTIFLIHFMACLATILLGRRCQYWGQISVIVSSALGALSLCEVGNLFFSRMTELGESCYLNMRQLAAFQMVYSGLLSLLALLITTMSAGLEYQLDILKTGLYIMVPFVFTECVCLTVMLMEAGRRNLLLLVAIGIFSALFWSVLAMVPKLYEASALTFWIVGLIAGTGIFIMLLGCFFDAIDKGEILCAD